MLAAGGLLTVLMMGFAMSGMFSSEDGENAALDADTSEDDSALDIDVDDGGDGLAQFLFGDDESVGSSDDDGYDVMADDGDDDWLYDDNGDDDLNDDEDDDALDDGDLFKLGTGDIGSGRAGADIFEISAMTQGPDGEDIPCVEDFQPGVDKLILDFDGLPDDQPEIGFDIETSPGDTLVLADGIAVTMLEAITGLEPDDIDVRMSGEEAQNSESTPGETIDGTDGDDTLTGGDADDTLDGYAGDDLLNGGTGDDLLRGREGMDSLFGEGGDDAITGGIGDDQIAGGAQNDVLFGNEGQDSIEGGSGADEVYGDEGNDTLEGGEDSDFLVGGDGHDMISGDEGGDLLFGNDGDDDLKGGEGDDYLQGGFGADTLDGGAGDDRLDGTFATGDSIFGPFDEDGADQLLGGDGDDTIVLGANDVATGGDGQDTFVSGSYVETAEVAGLVQDFDPSQDVIEVMYDPDLTPDPDITVEDFDDGSGANIMLDGQIILRVAGAQGLNPGAVELREVSLDAVPEPA